MYANLPSPGRLFYLIGPSGAGKDSLICYARRRIGGAPVRFARRYITREADAGDEQHVAVSRSDFARMLDSGLFAMHWRANGLEYGIGIEIDAWLVAGLNVVVNGSRAYLDVAAQRYPTLCPVLVEVADEVLAERLIARGRETPADIRARIARNRALPRPEHPALELIHNDGELADAGDA
ncbi:MAG: phosphonate metabolism protein/1,5-bisphosphokinase (PRPP-forming) PhnN [Azoarcus sp.]|nr:phosphonate metabolism protein/1,5-bisphosphokinase (PRPP-forming) PhnN [Azoarcus sp.]